MRIAIFGAAGSVGGRVAAEALRRGHEVTAVVRRPESLAELPGAAKAQVGDAADAAQVAAISTGQDAVIGAIRPAPGDRSDLAAATRALLGGTARAGVRLLVVGGAATLAVPGGGGTIALDDPRFVPRAWRGIAAASAEQHAVCRADTEADWTYLSPPAVLEPGRRTGVFRVGNDELLVDDQGASSISVEDLAVALLDESEHPRHRGARFTVAY